MNPAPRRLSTQAFDKVWGSPLTEPWYPNPEQRNIGEVWFSAIEVPLLVKLLFTSENLSVQVHPNDDYAAKHEKSAGKTEMWHVLRAEPDSKVAVGLRNPISPDELRAASLDGRIMDLLDWRTASIGDTFFIPAGTIHAIGSGLVLCEIQQVSDVTYRLYDYGRGRELHLDKALDVSYLQPHEQVLSECPYFRTERLTITQTGSIATGANRNICVVLSGHGTIASESFRAGEAWELSPSPDDYEIQSSDATFLITFKPS